MNEIREAYENRPYPHYAHRLTAIAHLAAVARILGAEAADPRRAAVLDLGCGSGSGLLAMAERLPGSRFKGLDFSAPEIRSARALAEEAGLANVEFRHADLLHWRPEAGERYDYIIAYGVFSWVPDEVKERLLRLCRECLSPRGIVCVSYMTLPGCAQADLFRDLLKLRAEPEPTPEARIASAHEVLDFLDSAYAAAAGQPHAAYFQDQVRRIRDKEPHFLLHDDLGHHRDPCYLLQFTGAAAAHGLRYLGESEFPMMLAENLPPPTARALAAMNLDRLQTEQFIDYIVNRSFRCSLLTAAGNDPGGGPDGLHPEAISGLCLSSSLQPQAHSPGLLNPEKPEGKFATAAGHPATLRSLPLISFILALAARPGAFTPYAEILDEARALAGRPFTEAEETRLRQDLLSLYGRNLLLLSAVPFSPPGEIPDRPRLSPLNRAFAARRGMLVTPALEVLPLTPARREFCALLDGSRTRGTLQKHPLPGDSPDRALDAFLRAGALES